MRANSTSGPIRSDRPRDRLESRAACATTALARCRVLRHDLDTAATSSCAMLLMPAVIVGDHGDQRVEISASRARFRLCRPRHADDIGAARLEAERLGQRRRLRTFDADVSAPIAAGNVSPLEPRRRGAGATTERSDAPSRHGRRSRRRRNSFAADRCGPRTDRSSRTCRDQFAVERSAGGKSNDVGDPDSFQRVDIGAVIDRRRREAMAPAMTGEEHRLRLPHVRSGASRKDRPTASRFVLPGGRSGRGDDRRQPPTTPTIALAMGPPFRRAALFLSEAPPSIAAQPPNRHMAGSNGCASRDCRERNGVQPPTSFGRC